MVLQSVGAIEALAALIAAVATLAAMNQAMLIENRSCEEALATFQAPRVEQIIIKRFEKFRMLLHVWTFSGVALSNVVVEIGSDGEASIATLIGTFERLDALMESQVLPEVARLRVRLAAHLAQVVARTCRHLVNAAASD